MFGMNLTRAQRLTAIIVISFVFFVAEISVGFYTRSLALVADAFHYLSDLLSFVVALAALKVSERSPALHGLTFGWQRTQLLGAFFNGVFLMALSVSVFLQAVERMVAVQPVERPVLMFATGCVGLALNILSAVFLHEHDHGHGPGHSHGDNDLSGAQEFSSTISLTEVHQHHRDHNHTRGAEQRGKAERDLGMLGVLVHVLSDALNNLGVIGAALIIWLTHSPGRFYADPAVGLLISIIILLSSVPLVKNAGRILLETAPAGVDLLHVREDMERVEGVEGVHELHVWRLNQEKSIAAAHVVTSEASLTNFMDSARRIGECLHEYGIHSVTLQPELLEEPEYQPQIQPVEAKGREGDAYPRVRRRERSEEAERCRITCGSRCEVLTCCG